MPAETRPILSVSQLSRQARQLLEDCFPAVWVEGELSALSQPASGHWYFTLKDDSAQIGCAMFRRQALGVRGPVRNGQRVLLRARVSLYEPRGQFQLIVEHLEDAGAGALQRAFEQLKARLQAEGLFEPGRKRPLPALPRHLGIITSASGAALHDILTVLRRRFPALPVTLLPVTVQGATAAAEIVAAIARANRLGERLEPPLDVLIVGRGGGAPEDLDAFNQESVARAIAASRLPVVSAIGHEVDVTIADFVADLRAATPSAAAELVSPDQAAWRELLGGQRERLQRLLKGRLETARQQTDWLARRLRHPRETLAGQRRRLDGLELRLLRAGRQQAQARRQALQALQQRLALLAPTRTLARQRPQLAGLALRLQRAWPLRLQACRRQLAAQAQLLHSLSPLGVLERGYAIVRDDRQRILRRADAVAVGSRLHTRLAQGSLYSTVTDIHATDDPATD